MCSVFVIDLLGFVHFCTDSSGPSSTVSSAGPSSPLTADMSPRFSFSEKTALTPQSSEEIQSSFHTASQSAPPPSSYLPESPLSDPGLATDPQPHSPDRPSDFTMDSTASTDSPPPDGPECEQTEESQSTTEFKTDSSPPYSPSCSPPCLAVESFSNLPGSLPVLLELRESSSEAGSSTQTPLSPDEPEEFFNTQETVEVRGFFLFICRSMYNLVQMAEISDVLFNIICS